MAVALVASTKKNGTGNSVTSNAIDTTGATLLIVATNSSGSAAIPVISDNKGNTWNTLTTYSRTVISYAVNPTVGTGHTFTGTRTSSFPSIVVGAFSGAKLSSPFDQQNGATTASATSLSTGSITPTENDELLVFALGRNASSAVSVNVGSILEDQANAPGTAYGIAIGYEIQTTATARNPQFSWSGATGAGAAIASFKAEPGAGGTTFFQSVSGSVTGTGSISKETHKALAGSITSTGSLSSRSVFTLALAGSITLVGAISRKTKKALAGAITATGSVRKKTSRLLTGALTVAGSVSTRSLLQQAVAGAITMAGALSSFKFTVVIEAVVNRLVGLRRFIGRR